jgi:hypothetical protein
MRYYIESFFENSLIFKSEARSLSKDFTLTRKILQGTNALAYFASPSVAKKKVLEH